MVDRPDLAESLAEAAREINSPRDLDTILDTIVHVAQRSLPGIDHVGISLGHKTGKIETKAGTDPLVWTLDEFQYDLGEGPCVHAITTEPVVWVNNLRHEQRWPRWTPHAVEAGVRAQLGIRLFLDDKTLGGLNCYSTEIDVIPPEVEHTAELFATHAALALGHARRAEELSTALASRRVIGQAVGIVMERYGLDEDRAFDYLIRVSQHGNVKLRDVAQELVAKCNALGGGSVDEVADGVADGAAGGR